MVPVAIGFVEPVRRLGCQGQEQGALAFRVRLKRILKKNALGSIQCRESFFDILRCNRFASGAVHGIERP